MLDHSLAKLSLFEHAHYQLTIPHLSSPLSVFNVEINEQLNQPWRYTITFTSPDKQIPIEAVLSQAASFTFHVGTPIQQLTQISSLQKPTLPRTVHGVITDFSQIHSNKEETHYQVVLQPRLALLGNQVQSAIYQQQSVIEVVESVLRSHGFTGIDYRLELKDDYPKREFMTQWQESDLAFIQRLLADVGVWLRFESHSEHNCDVVVISDYEQGYVDIGTVSYNAPSGMGDSGVESIWNLQQHTRTVTRAVQVQDYNYREATAGMLTEHNARPQDNTTHGVDYRYGEHYKQAGNIDQIESGKWYSQIRHEAQLSEQIIIEGESNLFQLAPGQLVRLNSVPLVKLNEGLVILAVYGQGDRKHAYQNRFTAIPFDVLKPYRPPVLPSPSISGTLPAKITSPDHDTYGYLDNHGRYRVKFNFDLNSWKSGSESLWLRLAKPYAGDTYGFHFPLIDGTEVAIAFTDGNPDRPYIAHAMHNSDKPDHITLANKQRNVIRTPANNKLRMDDKRGKEHIKLATEYGKTQLNLGYVVNKEKTKRGEGFELRTDEWGAIAAEKGLYLTTQTDAKASGNQLDMDGAIAQLENALSIAKALKDLSEHAQAHGSDMANQEKLKSALAQLEQSGLIAYAQAGIALTTPKNIQLSSSQSVAITAEEHTDISVLKKITLAAGEALSFFAHKLGIKLFAAQGKVEIQAQNDAMALAAKQGITLDSVDSSVTVSAASDITLMAGGSYIKISDAGIELGSSGNVTMKTAGVQKIGPASVSPPAINLPNVNGCSEFFILINNETGEPLPFHPYDIEVNGKTIAGITDALGRTQRIFTDSAQTVSGAANEKIDDFLKIEAIRKGDGKPVTLNFSQDETQ